MRTVKLFSRTLQFLPNRPVPEAQATLRQEFKQVEVAVKQVPNIKGVRGQGQGQGKPPTRKKHEPLSLRLSR